MYGCYIGCSNIPEFKEKGHSGGVVSTLCHYAIRIHLVDGMLVSKQFKTFVAWSKQDVLESCGSIYEDFKYSKIKVKNAHIGQVGKPCDLDSRYLFKISVFCSHVVKPQFERVTSRNRRLLSLFDIPFRCLMCYDHIGRFADISVGDYHADPSKNFIVVNSWKGKQFFDRAIKDKYVVCLKTTKSVETLQPYLYETWREKILWSISKIKKLL